MRFRYRIRTILFVTTLLAFALVLGSPWLYPPGVSVNVVGPSTFKVEGKPVASDQLATELSFYAERVGGSRPRLLRIYVADEGGLSSGDVSKVIEIGSTAGFESFAVDYYSDDLLGKLDF